MGESSVVEMVVGAVGGDEAGQPARLCAALRQGLPVDGASISLFSEFQNSQLLGASGTSALRLEEVQFTAAEGPGITAADSGEPVIVPDLHHAPTLWPVFGVCAREQLPDVGAVYAFPLMVGPYTLGAVTLISHRPADLEPEQLERGVRAAGTVAAVLVPAFRNLFLQGGLPPWEPSCVIDAHWGATHRAMGTLAQRMRITPADALAWIRARAFASGRSVPDVTAQILGPPPGPLPDLL